MKDNFHCFFRDDKYGLNWQVIVGKEYGTYVTPEPGYVAFFYMDELAFYIFKTNCENKN